MGCDERQFRRDVEAGAIPIALTERNPDGSIRARWFKASVLRKLALKWRKEGRPSRSGAVDPAPGPIKAATKAEQPRRASDGRSGFPARKEYRPEREPYQPERRRPEAAGSAAPEDAPASVSSVTAPMPEAPPAPAARLAPVGARASGREPMQLPDDWIDADFKAALQACQSGTGSEVANIASDPFNVPSSPPADSDPGLPEDILPMAHPGPAKVRESIMAPLGHIAGRDEAEFEWFDEGPPSSTRTGT